ncbi:autotransporter outer membrane beta-barrel domain-containing protein [Pseudomonas sp. NFACC45]|uniref:autotransporter outer membrane beta-barrel domain-containing protein n=1 Tax=Pseudomonas sp. NFACC45 TaxID=1566201 RepID=UPI0008E6B2EC|nr:autotransporter outer membrane beta-barrel domain-containing protein [Pseudomonas sp. NFACC45]SFG96401.1 outer membrane autotransporter barrel domain-containing protein [Pseudomonas sp. NFACC45]
MSSRPGFIFRKTSISLSVLLCLPLLINASLAQAGTVPAGQSLPIDATTPVETWAIESGATLIGSGATTFGITSTTGGTVDMTNSTISSAGEGGLNQGIFLSNASATLNNSTVTSTTGTGISAVRNINSVGGSRVTLSNNSTVRGLTGGIGGNRFSELNIQNSTVEGTGANSFGIRLLESTLSASGSTITGGLNGLTVGTDTLATTVIPTSIVLDGTRVEGVTGSAIVVGINAPNFPTVANITVRNDSTLVGGNGTLLEIRDGASADLLVDNSELTGNVVVDAGGSGNVVLQNAASLTGDLQNVTSATLNNQARMTGNVLGASSVVINNASSLTGNLQEVGSASIDNRSVMVGDVTGAANSVSSLTLDNAASLTGQVNNISNFAISNQALWQMTDSQSVSNLTLNSGGTVRLGGDQEYFQLDVANLAGNGRFEIGTDFNQGISDLLNITGSATGNHQLLVASSGLDPVNEDSIKVVQSVASGAQYDLVNDRVDVGAYTYRLVKNGDDWYLQPDKDVISTPTRSVMAIFGTAPTVIYGEMALLNTRMGDLRVNGGQTGGWVRTFGSRYSITNKAYGNGYSQNQHGISLGVDTPVDIAGERVLLGVFAGYSKSNLDLSRGSSGEIDSTSLGMYGTWLGDSGYYLDTVAKLNHFRNDAKVTMSDGTKTKGGYNNLGASASVEFGKHIDIKDGYYVEPFTQWQVATVQGKDFNLNNGLKADADTTRSMLGKVGVTMGRGMTLDDGSVLQPHIRTAVVQEFAKHNEVRVNDNKFNNDLSGTRFEVAAGASWTLSDRWQVHAELDTSKGDNLTKDFGFNFGAHYQF